MDFFPLCEKLLVLFACQASLKGAVESMLLGDHSNVALTGVVGSLTSQYIGNRQLRAWVVGARSRGWLPWHTYWHRLTKSRNLRNMLIFTELNEYVLVSIHQIPWTCHDSSALEYFWNCFWRQIGTLSCEYSSSWKIILWEYKSTVPKSSYALQIHLYTIPSKLAFFKVSNP